MYLYWFSLRFYGWAARDATHLQKIKNVWITWYCFSNEILTGEKMVKSYSVDLRKRVVKYVEETKDKRKASQLFKVGIATVYLYHVPCKK